MRKKLNILIASGIFPFPPNDGGKICVYSFIDRLRHIQNIYLFLPIYNAEQSEIVEAMKLEWSNVTICTAEEYTLENDLNLKAKLLKTVKNKGREVLSFLETFRRKRFPLHDNSYVNRVVSPPLSPDSIKKFSEILHRTEFDIVQMESTPSLNLVNVVPEGTKRVFVEIESLHSIIKDYQTIPGVDKKHIDYLSENAKTVELAYMSKYDAIFTLSQVDEDNLKRLMPDQKIYTSSYPILDSDITKEDLDTFAAKKIVFMGNESHLPNKDGMTWFAEKIVPLLNLKDNVNVYITGIWQAETIKKISALSDRIIFTGFVKDIKPLLKNSISIAPIRLGGGGVRSKLIYAMALNSAIVTTFKASVGIMGKDKKDFIIADSEREFADSINSILNDAKLFETLVKNGRDIVRKYYDQTALTERRNNYYYEILNG